MIKTKSQYIKVHACIMLTAIFISTKITDDPFAMLLVVIVSMCHLVFTQVVQPLFE